MPDIHQSVIDAQLRRMIEASRNLKRHQLRKRYGRLVGTVLGWVVA